jgi:EAL and modified HD-GYP domain-containing signal transduction protein
MGVIPARDDLSDEVAPVCVARQPVLDARDRVTGYRISYAVLADDRPTTPDAAQARALADEALSVIGREEQVMGSMAHLPVTREMLLMGGVPPVRPDQVLLRIRYEEAVDESMVEVLERAAGRGYALELDGLPGPEFDVRLLDVFSTVEIDVSSWDLQDVTEAVPLIRDHHAVALAAGVRDHAQREHARSIGFEWFTGPYYAKPNLLAGSPIPIGSRRTLVELARLQGADAPLEQLIQIIELDLGLAVRLLRYINSAYFGLAGRVRSIRHAGAMLGARGLSRWALITAAITGEHPIPRELALLALTRARTCELLTLALGEPVDADEMFTVGLLSTVDALFGMPIEDVVGELPLAESVAAALTRRSGRTGEMLESVLAFEAGDFLAPGLRSTIRANALAYRDGLDWAREALTGLS